MRTLIVIPAYNESEAIAATVKTVVDAGYDYVVVNDGSTDATLQVCREHGFNVLNLSQNLGIGGAVQAGHKYAYEHGYDVDIQFDGDGQHDISCVPLFEEKVSQGAELVIGSRFLEEHDGFKSTLMRRIGIKWLSVVIKLLTKKRITDPTSGSRAVAGKALELFADDYPVDYPEPESIVTALRKGVEVDEVQVVMHERQGGTSSIGPLSSVYYMIKVTLAMLIAGTAKQGR